MRARAYCDCTREGVREFRVWVYGGGRVLIQCPFCGEGSIASDWQASSVGGSSGIREDEAVGGAKDVSADLVSEEEGGASVKRRGRPKIEGPRPWHIAGISRALYYKRIKLGKVPPNAG